MDAGGIRLRTKRRVYMRGDGGRPIPKRLTVSIDISDIRFNSNIETFAGLDVLLNNASYGNVSSVEDTSSADFPHRSRRISLV